MFLFALTTWNWKKLFELTRFPISPLPPLSHILHLCFQWYSSTASAKAKREQWRSSACVHSVVELPWHCDVDVIISSGLVTNVWLHVGSINVFFSFMPNKKCCVGTCLLNGSKLRRSEFVYLFNYSIFPLQSNYLKSYCKSWRTNQSYNYETKKPLYLL